MLTLEFQSQADKGNGFVKNFSLFVKLVFVSIIQGA